MRVFLTGATGFIGSRILRDLIDCGHGVTGVARSADGARGIEAAGGVPYFATLEEPDLLAAGAALADAVIHTAFDHDFSRFAENCAKDARVITAIGDALAGSDRPLIITSGTGLGNVEVGQPAVEQAVDWDYPNPRVASERAGAALLDKGISVAVVRLPQVHDTRRQGLITPYIEMARAKGLVAYVGDGANRWPAAHVADVARLYVLALDRHAPGARYHAVAEEGLAMRRIAETIGIRLDLPVASIASEQATDYFGWMSGFAAMDMPASSVWTRQALGWEPTGRGLIADLEELDL